MDSDLAFDWDDANRDHTARHQVSPEEAEQVVENNPLDIEAGIVDGEERITSIGGTDQAGSSWSSPRSAKNVFASSPRFLRPKV